MAVENKKWREFVGKDFQTRHLCHWGSGESKLTTVNSSEWVSEFVVWSHQHLCCYRCSSDELGLVSSPCVFFSTYSRRECLEMWNCFPQSVATYLLLVNDIFYVNLASQSRQFTSCTCPERELFLCVWCPSASQLCQSTEGSKKHQPVVWSYPFFIHYGTALGSDVGPLVPAVWSQYSKW